MTQLIKLFKLDLNIIYLLFLQLFKQLTSDPIIFENSIWIPDLTISDLLIYLVHYLLLLYQWIGLLFQLVYVLLFLLFHWSNDLTFLSINDLLDFGYKLIHSSHLLLILCLQLDQHLFIRSRFTIEFSL